MLHFPLLYDDIVFDFFLNILCESGAAIVSLHRRGNSLYAMHMLLDSRVLSSGVVRLGRPTITLGICVADHIPKC